MALWMAAPRPWMLSSVQLMCVCVGGGGGGGGGNVFMTVERTDYAGNVPITFICNTVEQPANYIYMHRVPLIQQFVGSRQLRREVAFSV